MANINLCKSSIMNFCDRSHHVRYIDFSSLWPCKFRSRSWSTTLLQWSHSMANIYKCRSWSFSLHITILEIFTVKNSRSSRRRSMSWSRKTRLAPFNWKCSMKRWFSQNCIYLWAYVYAEQRIHTRVRAARTPSRMHARTHIQTHAVVQEWLMGKYYCTLGAISWVAVS